MAQIWQHNNTLFNIEIHEVGSSFYRLRRTIKVNPNDKQMQSK